MAELTLTELLAQVDKAHELAEEASAESSRANSKECEARNSMADAAKKMAKLLADQPREFVREFDRAWNDDETVRHLRPKPVRAA